jgi:hypothetical protein
MSRPHHKDSQALRAAEGGVSKDGPEDEIDGRRAYALRNFGWRFSMNAFMPSF